MKTLIMVIILILFFISPAFADLVSSKHNLSSLGGEPCAYCHSVHHAAGGLGRPAYMGPMPDITVIYDSDHLILAPLTLTSANNSDAPLCLTCHDGAFASNSTNSSMAAIGAIILGTHADIGSPNSGGSSLENDHPVGFVFDASKDPSKIKAPTNIKVHVAFGPAKNEMWCSTCHDVHDGTYSPFLSMSNAGSALCLECHIK